MTKKDKQPVVEKTAPKGLRLDGAFGIFLLFVCVSIGYANYIVFFGTSDPISKFMLIPSTVAVALFLLYKSMK